MTEDRGQEEEKEVRNKQRQERGQAMIQESKSQINVKK